MHVYVKRTLLGWHALRYRATTGRHGIGWARSGSERSGICVVLFGHGLLIHRMPPA